MIKKLFSIAIFMVISALLTPVHAQFNTIRDVRQVNYEYIKRPTKAPESIELKIDTIKQTESANFDSIEMPNTKSFNIKTTNEPVRKKHLDYNRKYEGLPNLTINNLLYEIRKNGIQHEKVVLAQAILETGWFTSSVCRNKNNLFGLTNPRTGQYYEFNHWTESVKAYYTKVQYRYKGGNYLLWLDKIGYAEDKVYVASLIRILKQYFI